MACVVKFGFRSVGRSLVVQDVEKVCGPTFVSFFLTSQPAATPIPRLTADFQSYSGSLFFKPSSDVLAAPLYTGSAWRGEEKRLPFLSLEENDRFSIVSLHSRRSRSTFSPVLVRNVLKRDCAGHAGKVVFQGNGGAF